MQAACIILPLRANKTRGFTAGPPRSVGPRRATPGALGIRHIQYLKHQELQQVGRQRKDGRKEQLHHQVAAVAGVVLGQDGGAEEEPAGQQQDRQRQHGHKRQARHGHGPWVASERPSAQRYCLAEELQPTRQFVYGAMAIERRWTDNERNGFEQPGSPASRLPVQRSSRSTHWADLQDWPIDCPMRLAIDFCS